MLYNLVRKLDNFVECENLTAIKLAEVSCSGRINIALYNVVEVSNSELKEKPLVSLSEKEQSFLLFEFKKTLSPAQVNDINTGKKKIVYSINVGFHLRTTEYGKEEKEIYVSIEEQKLKRIQHINEIIKKHLLNIESDFYLFARGEMEITMGEFAEAFEKFVKR